MLDHASPPYGGGGGGGAYVLTNLPTKGHSQRLNAATNAEHGHLAVVGQAGDKQLGQVALAVDATESGHRFLAAVQGVDVAATAENKRIDVVERVHQHGLVGRRRNNDGRAPGTDDRLVIALAQLAGKVLVVARNANDGLTAGSGIAAVHRVDMVLQIKTFHLSLFTFHPSLPTFHFSISSKCTGISRLMLCSNEMSVSVDVTP